MSSFTSNTEFARLVLAAFGLAVFLGFIVASTTSSTPLFALNIAHAQGGAGCGGTGCAGSTSTEPPPPYEPQPWIQAGFRPIPPPTGSGSDNPQPPGSNPNRSDGVEN